jgi:hypothetical protein
MDKFIPLLVGGVVGLTGIAISFLVAYRRLIGLRASLLTKIEEAKRKFNADLGQIDYSELAQTEAGRELLKAIQTSRGISQWQKTSIIPFQKDVLERTLIRELASNLVSTVFPKEIDIFETVANAFLSRDELRPVLTSNNLGLAGLGMGNLGNLGSLQALSFALFVIQPIIRTIESETLPIHEAAHRFLSQPDALNQIVKQAESIGFDTKTAKKLAQVTLDILIE